MALRSLIVAASIAIAACAPSVPVRTTAPPDAVVTTGASLSPSPSTTDALSYFRSVPGYGWVAPPPALQSSLEASFSASGARQVFIGLPVIRVVTMGGGPTDLLLMCVVTDPTKGLIPTPLDAMVRSYGGTPTFVPVSGLRTAFLPADARRPLKLLLWQQKQFLLVLFAASLSTMDNMTAFARLLIDANGETRTV